jgi:hypothetical protein
MQWLNVGVVIFTFLLIAFSLKAAFEFRQLCEDIAKTEVVVPPSTRFALLR